MTTHYKYPSTPHLPWSRCVQPDDAQLSACNHFEERQVVVTEKMDGENATLYRDHTHARSLDSGHHPSRSWVKNLHGRIGWQIPHGWRLCGENLYAVHSIRYQDLAGYFYLFSVWDQDNCCLSWDETEAWATRLSLPTPPVLYRGKWDPRRIADIPVDTERSEGYVMRTADRFPYEVFSRRVAKWVRPNHVQTDEHWMFKPVVPNGLARRSHDSGPPFCWTPWSSVVMNPLVKEILEGGVVGLDRFLTEWSPAFPLLPALADTPQDPEWHAEGNVYTHTSMVLDQLYDLISSPALLQELGLTDLRRGWGRVALVLAALFHDIAKPLTTTEREIRGRRRIVAPRHAGRGRDWLAHRVLYLELPERVTFQVLNLVGAHHDPKLLVVRDKPRGQWIRLAHRVDPRLVYLLELADMRGRRCNDQGEQIELIELFRAGCEEYGIFDGGQREKMEHSWHGTIEQLVPEWPQRDKDVALYEGMHSLYAGEIFRPEEAVARGWQWRGRGKLLLLCGVSASGKSSLAARRARDHSQDQIVISLDRIRKDLTGDAADQSANRKVVSIAKDRVREALGDGHTAVLDATNTRRELREQWVQLGRNYKALVTIHVQLALPHTISARNASRQRSVPGKVLERQLERFQLPWPDEAHQVSVQCGGPE